MNTIITTTTNNALVARHIAAVTIEKNSPLMGVAKSMMIEEAKRQMRAGTCHFLYVKKDGSVREAFGTLNPALCDKHINGRGQSPETWIYWNREKSNYLTPQENIALAVFRRISNSYKDAGIKKEEKPFDFSSVVDYTGKSSNFFEDLAALDAYSQSIENDIDTLPDKK